MPVRALGEHYILSLRVGDLVEVRSQNEILATLDSTGRLDGLPFMPEMLDHCGKRFRVYKRADKACDTIGKTGLRRMENAVHLEGLRCDGAAHGGCQAGCLFFWKEAWLKPVQNRPDQTLIMAQANSYGKRSRTPSQEPSIACTADLLFKATQQANNATDGEDAVFSCQATELFKATSYLAWWDVRQYLRDVRTGNISLGQLIRGAGIAAWNMTMRNLHQCVLAISALTALLSGVHVESPELTSSAFIPSLGSKPAKLRFTKRLRALLPESLAGYPRIQGKLKHTPSCVLNLHPGELVHVKSASEIVETLDTENKNRGLRFDVEMLPYCGGTYRVLRRVEKIIDEKTGRMRRLPNDCIILDGVVCKACYSNKRLFCPRSIYSYWREIWLKRIELPESKRKPETAQISSCQ